MSFSTTTDKVGPLTLASYSTPLAVTFPFQNKSDLLVLNIGPASTPYATAVTLTQNADYTVDGGGYNENYDMQTGTVTIIRYGPHDVQINDRMVIVRNAPENQLTSFLTNGLLTVAMIEAALDKGVTLTQAVEREVLHALRIPYTESNLPEMTKDQRAGSVIAFDTDGNLSFTYGTTYYNGVAANAAAAAASATASQASAVASATSASNSAGSATASANSATAAANSAVDAANSATQIAALIPDQTGHAGQFLKTDGYSTSWVVGGSGTVTSVGLSGGTTGLTASNTPVTTSGIITLSGTLNVANGGTGATTAANARTNLGLGSIATQSAASVAISGGAIDNTTIGNTTPTTAKFTTVAATGVAATRTDGNYQFTSASATKTFGIATSGTNFLLDDVTAGVNRFAIGGSGTPSFSALSSNGFVKAISGNGTLTTSSTVSITSEVSGLGAGIATFLSTPTSANLAAAVTDESGTGNLLFSVSPAMTGTPTVPTAAAGDNTTKIASTAYVQANRGDKYLTTSTSTNTIDNGNNKTFVVATDLSYIPTQTVTVVYDFSNHMHCDVVSYNSTTGVMVVNSISHTGSGTYSAWTINLGGLTSSSGALLSANNLSDVASVSTSATNLGLGASSSVTHGSLTLSTALPVTSGGTGVTTATGTGSVVRATAPTLAGLKSLDDTGGYQIIAGQLTGGDRMGIAGQASGTGTALVFFDNAQTTFRPSIFDASSHSFKISGVATTSITSTGFQGAIGATTASTGRFTTVTATSTISGSNLSGTNTGDQTISITGDVTAAGSTGALTATVTKINGTALSGLATGILKNTTTTGVPSIAVAADFPTLNQNTTGSAATLTTPRAIYGNNFDGSAALTQVIASTYGGTGNGFTKFSGPTTAEKTFTLPDSNATLLYSGGALGTPSSGTVTNLTGTASININGTVGATTANTGQFTTLFANGLIKYNGSSAGELQFNSTSATTQTHTISSYYNTGAAFAPLNISSGTITSYVSGSAISTLSSTGLAVTGALSTTGNATIGNSSTTGASRLVIDGLGTVGNVPMIQFKSAGVVKAYFGLSGGYLGTTATDAIIATDAAGASIVFATSDTGTIKAKIDASGNVGIGVTPSAWGSDYKAIQIGASATGAFSYKNFVTSLSQNVYSTNANDIALVNGNAAKYELNGSGQHVWKTAAATAGNAISFTQAMTLDASGNLGIGTSSPIGRFDVQTATNKHIGLRSASDIGGLSTGVLIEAFNDNAAATIPLQIDGSLVAINSLSGGNVGIGTSSPTGGYKLDVAGNIFMSSGDTFRMKNSSSNFSFLRFEQNSSTAAYTYLTADGRSTGYLSFSTNDTERARITSAGLFTVGTGNTGAGIINSNFNGSTQDGIEAGDTVDASGAQFFVCRNSAGTAIGSIQRVTTTNGVVYNITSDGRLKENLRDFTDSGHLIDSLKPRMFDWKNSDENGKNVIGFIAQEEHAADPIFAHIGAVSVGDKDPDTITKQWQRSDSALIPILVAELKALRQRVAALESN